MGENVGREGKKRERVGTDRVWGLGSPRLPIETVPKTGGDEPPAHPPSVDVDSEPPSLFLW